VARAYSFAQLEGFWIEAGGPRKVAPIMAAIGLAESGGRNIKQKGHHPRSETGWGIWQITPGGPALLNPRRNAEAAVRKYREQGLGAWTTYKTGAYKAHLQAGQNPQVAGFGILTPANFAGVDQGVDYRGQGVIPALDPIVITSVRRVSIIEGGTWPLVGFRYTAGPYKGHFGYVMENFTPKVKPGQHLKRGQPIGIAQGSYPYVEYGFASGPEGSPLAPLGADPHAPTGPGQAMLSYVQSRAGQQVAPSSGDKGGPPPPPHIPGVDSGSHDVYGPVTGTAVSTAHAAESVASFLGRLTDPHFWLRGLEIIGGMILVFFGLYLLARQAGMAPSAEQVASVTPVGRGAKLSEKAAAEMQFSPGRAARAGQRRTRRTVHQHYLDDRPKPRQISDPATNEIPY
jgi:hypothetical protein